MSVPGAQTATVSRLSTIILDSRLVLAGTLTRFGAAALLFSAAALLAAKGVLHVQAQIRGGYVELGGHIFGGVVFQVEWRLSSPEKCAASGLRPRG